MLGFLIAPLVDTLRPHFDLSKTRLATLSVLLVGLANSRTVNLSRLASRFPGSALKCCVQHFRAYAKSPFADTGVKDTLMAMLSSV